MLGTQEEPGIMFRALHDLFIEITNTSVDLLYQVSMSYLEIYNELIRDLLCPTAGFLELREVRMKIALKNRRKYKNTYLFNEFLFRMPKVEYKLVVCRKKLQKHHKKSCIYCIEETKKEHRK